MTNTNANFYKQRFVKKIKESIKLREQLKQTFLDKGGNPEKITFEGAFWTADSLEEMESKAGHVGVLSTENEDIRIRRGPCSRFLLLFLDIDNKTFFPWFSVFD